MVLLMKNLSSLNVFSHGQLQDFLTLLSLMKATGLTEKDIKKAVSKQIHGVPLSETKEQRKLRLSKIKPGPIQP